MNINFSSDTFGIINKLGLDIKNNPQDATVYFIESMMGYLKNEGYTQNEIFNKFSFVENNNIDELLQISDKDPRGFSAFIYLKVFNDEWKYLIESDLIH